MNSCRSIHLTPNVLPKRPSIISNCPYTNINELCKWKKAHHYSVLQTFHFRSMMFTETLGQMLMFWLGSVVHVWCKFCLIFCGTLALILHFSSITSFHRHRLWSTIQCIPCGFIQCVLATNAKCKHQKHLSYIKKTPIAPLIGRP